MRAIMLKLHRWLGLAAATPLVLLGMTGAVLSVETELDRWLNPGLWRVVPNGQKLDAQAALDYARSRFPAVLAMRLPPSDDLAIEFALPGNRLAYFDPYSGRMLGSRQRSDSPLVQIHQFHTRLLAGDWGSYVMGTASLGLVIVSLSGLVLWWPYRIWFFSAGARAKRLNFEAHNVLGLYVSLVWLVIGGTGAVLTFEAVVEPAVNWLTHAPDSRPPKLQSDSSRSGGKQISVIAALGTAREKLPEAQATLLALPVRATDVLVVYMKHPEDRTPAGRSRVYLDQFDGRVLHVTDTRQVPVGMQLRNRIRPLHTGDLFGWPTRVLAAFASLALVVQVGTGVWLWYRGRRGRRAAVSRNLDRAKRGGVVK
ncbi:MAG TPA: PepSY-associated TM helix domain-containing protein [Pirellulales bacterium]|jgi:uncharacterized iron-regulated membrane protein|nr:PepSY-associated TM helix domain-containing protein [Pirellulales bacterium]